MTTIDTTRPAPTYEDPKGFLSALVCGLAGFMLAGLLIGRLTLGSNPQVHRSAADTGTLLLFFALLYSLIGLTLGGGAGIVIHLLRKWAGAGRLSALASNIACSGLLLGPLLYIAALPSVGLTRSLIGDLFFGASLPKLVGIAIGIAVVVTLASVALAWPLRAAAARLQVRTRSMVTLVWTVAVLAVVVPSLLFRPSTASASATPATAVAPDVIPTPASVADPVILLNIDGADLEDVILPMVAKGELPTFARLLREGTWGELATIEPTRSHTIWTTIITGKSPEAHGIRNFTILRVPGLDNTLEALPLHTGLNRALPRLLRKIPGAPNLHAPYTSNMRRVDALWNIVSRYYPVGTYQWLISWPAEAFDGFCVSGGMRWAQYVDGFEDEVGSDLLRDSTHPDDIFEGVDLPERPSIPWEKVRPYVGGDDIDREDARLKYITKTLQDPTAKVLPELIEKYEPQFVAASFYSVDSFGHLFARFKDGGGLFSDAIAQSYRLTDKRLGELLATVSESTNVVVISDHGWDFVNNHHIFAPAGIFIGHGPAFEPGRQVEGLSIYDIAPLVLRLLDLPTPDDMPATEREAYETALAADFRATRPPTQIATYETGAARDLRAIESPLDEEITDVLRSLGYIQ